MLTSGLLASIPIRPDWSVYSVYSPHKDEEILYATKIGPDPDTAVRYEFALSSQFIETQREVSWLRQEIQWWLHGIGALRSMPPVPPSASIPPPRESVDDLTFPFDLRDFRDRVPPLRTTPVAAVKTLRSRAPVAEVPIQPVVNRHVRRIILEEE